MARTGASACDHGAALESTGPRSSLAYGLTRRTPQSVKERSGSHHATCLFSQLAVFLNESVMLVQQTTKSTPASALSAQSNHTAYQRSTCQSRFTLYFAWLRELNIATVLAFVEVHDHATTSRYLSATKTDESQLSRRCCTRNKVLNCRNLIEALEAAERL